MTDIDALKTYIIDIRESNPERALNVLERSLRSNKISPGSAKSIFKKIIPCIEISLAKIFAAQNFPSDHFNFQETEYTNLRSNNALLHKINAWIDDGQVMGALKATDRIRKTRIKEEKIIKILERCLDPKYGIEARLKAIDILTDIGTTKSLTSAIKGMAAISKRGNENSDIYQKILLRIPSAIRGFFGIAQPADLAEIGSTVKALATNVQDKDTEKVVIEKLASVGEYRHVKNLLQSPKFEKYATNAFYSTIGSSRPAAATYNFVAYLVKHYGEQQSFFEKGLDFFVSHGENEAAITALISLENKGIAALEKIKNPLAVQALQKISGIAPLEACEVLVKKRNESTDNLNCQIDQVLRRSLTVLFSELNILEEVFASRQKVARLGDVFSAAVKFGLLPEYLKNYPDIVAAEIVEQEKLSKADKKLKSQAEGLQKLLASLSDRVNGLQSTTDLTADQNLTKIMKSYNVVLGEFQAASTSFETAKTQSNRMHVLILESLNISSSETFEIV